VIVAQGRMRAGAFISFEGVEGSGKTTQVHLLGERLADAGHEVVIVHEPGGTALGDTLRNLLLRRDAPPIGALAEAMLFAACRAELMTEVVKPKLERGAVVLADRFADSSRAYQVGGRGLDGSAVEQLITLASLGLEPDITILLDVPPTHGLARRAADDASRWTRFEAEGEDFHERVRAAYAALREAAPARWVLIDGNRSIEAVAMDVWTSVAPRLLAEGNTPLH